jgi:lipoyltransferase and lipoate-protein ligase
MYYIIDRHSTDPQWNLAAEEYLFKQLDEPVFRLWQNAPSIIIGLHQNAYAEINVDYVRQSKIKVVRRMTGGGAVFHDLGNINFTFIDNRIEAEDSAAMFARFTKPILEALAALGVDARLEGRNDLVIDGKKFSGNAIAVYKNRVLQHGTLLFSSSIQNLSEALATRAEHFTGKAVKSNIARVTNISRHLPEPMDIEEFILYLEKFILSREKGSYKPYQYTPEDLRAIESIKRERYGSDKWNFGAAPKYSYSKLSRFNGGIVELFMDVENGVIRDIRIYGSYFFTKESAEFENLFKGIPHTVDAISKVIDTVNLNEYLSNITKAEFLTMF